MAKPTFKEAKPGSFVYIIDQGLSLATCRDMIDRFERNKDQQYQGRIGQDATQASQVKRSTDLRISGREDWRDIDQQLRQSLSLGLGLLSGLHPFFRANRIGDIGYNMQRTEPGEYYHWHIDSGPGEFTKRQLVAIWYLNNGPEVGGETEFYFQQLSIKPKAGTLLLFPPFWTHLHRGKMVESDVKYIATTWVCVD